MWNETPKQIKSRRGLSASQKLTHSRRVLSFNQGPVVFIWNDDKRTHSLTMKRNE